MATVAVLGGGISGLSCAYYLKTLGGSRIKYLFLLEKGPKFGGWIQSTKYPDGAVCELGPRSVRAVGKEGYNLLMLAEDLNLTNRIIPVSKHHPAAKRRFVLVNKQLVTIPNSPKYLFLARKPFSKGLYRCIFRDLTAPKKVCSDDSVYSFGERRFGKEIADYVFDPLCRGISGGDARETSLRTLLPDMYRAEQTHGSLIKGFVASQRSGSGVGEYFHSPLINLARQQSWRMWNLKTGLAELVETLASVVDERGFADIHVNAECTKLTFKDGKALVTVDGEDIAADHVFSSVPAASIARLLEPYNKLSSVLKTIPSVSMAVVYLEYSGFVLKEEGFGFLTPSFEDTKVLGVTFDSCCFPDHNGPNRTRITCMMGGKWFNNLFGDVDSVETESLLQVATEEVKKYLGITVSPTRHHVAVLKNCIPQYTIGHHEKIETITDEIMKNNLPLTLVGAYHSGAGVPQCVFHARKAAEHYLKNL